MSLHPKPCVACGTDLRRRRESIDAGDGRVLCAGCFALTLPKQAELPFPLLQATGTE